MDSKAAEGSGRNRQKNGAEGVDEADYACYASPQIRHTPEGLAEMTTPERMFCCAVIEMEIAAEEKR